MFYCAIWAIWKDRNKKVHDIKIIIGKDTANFVSSYMEELKRLEENTCTKRKEDVSWKAPSSLVIKINFDSAFDGRRFRLVLGVATKDERGAVFLTHTSFHKGVLSAFAAEALACQLADNDGETEITELIAKGKFEEWGERSFFLLMFDLSFLDAPSWFCETFSFEH
ncbi:hypothetical protein Goshw_023498 [Gossypium schwendimanii]|uniref:RNase H type-1 domain-containing protein n=1 Tax=Gossypium schwendimanii TaxID=34291 RepID=A0A7J9MYI4_GOSSC|nr:hypothetical protein [Gossypium schwendimanii]